MKGNRNQNTIFKIVPPTYFYLGILFIAVIYFVFPEFNLICFPNNLFGILLMIIGVILIIWPWYSFKKHETPEDFNEPTSMVTSGSYKFSRNPMYLGGTLALLGIALCLGNVFCSIIPITFLLLMNFIFIPYEERKMSNLFGDKYYKYKQRVRRWL